MSAMRNIPFGNSKKAKAETGGPSEKEFHKLRRVDLLELLLDQMRENEKLSTSEAELSELTTRLKAKLDQKDEQIERLKAKLDQKDEQIAHLQDRYRTLARVAGLPDALEQYEYEERAFERYLDEVAGRKAGGAVASEAVEAEAIEATPPANADEPENDGLEAAE